MWELDWWVLNQGWHGTFYQLGKTGWVKLGQMVGFTHWVRLMYPKIIVYYGCKDNVMHFTVKCRFLGKT